MLTVQYGMHTDIMSWSSGALHGGCIEAAPLVAGHTLRDLQVGFVGSLVQCSVLLFMYEEAHRSSRVVGVCKKWSSVRLKECCRSG